MKSLKVITTGVLFTFVVVISGVLAVSAEEVGVHERVIAELEARIAEMENLLKKHGLDVGSIESRTSIERTVTKEPEESVEKRKEEPLEVENPPPPIIPLPTESIGDSSQVIECLRVERVMRFGDYREDVTKLQEFLEARGHFSHPHITWYFGPVTESAVQAFQSAEGIVSHGTPQTTGFGQVGPMTARIIEKLTCETPSIGSDI